jgi:hypothetical protein
MMCSHTPAQTSVSLLARIHFAKLFEAKRAGGTLLKPLLQALRVVDVAAPELINWSCTKMVQDVSGYCSFVLKENCWIQTIQTIHKNYFLMSFNLSENAVPKRRK